jgi:hypothetical protein
MIIPFKLLAVLLTLALLFFITYRYFCTLLYFIVRKVFHKNFKENYVDIVEGLTLLWAFIFVYIASIKSLQEIIAESEMYFVTLIFGIVGIIWCYFRWRIYSFKELPQWEDNEKYMATKKIIIFSLVFIFTIYYGYSQYSSIVVSEYKVNSIEVLGNTAKVTCLIALDRILNQFYTLYKYKKMNITNKEKKSMSQIEKILEDVKLIGYDIKK